MKLDLSQMARQVGAIGLVTFRELLREKILWSSFMFALLCVGVSYAVSQLSFTDNSRIALDFGLASISIVGGLISVIMGAGLVAKEVQNRTLYLVLTKSIWRWQFVVGRFVGLLGVLLVNSFLMMAILLGVFLLLGGQLEVSFLKCYLLQATEFAVLSASACIFSALSTSTLAAIFTSGVWVIGHAIPDLKILSTKMEPAYVGSLLKSVTYVLPDLTKFDVKAQVAHQLPITWTYLSVGMIYGVAYVVFALILSCLIFSRRDL